MSTPTRRRFWWRDALIAGGISLLLATLAVVQPQLGFVLGALAIIPAFLGLLYGVVSLVKEEKRRIAIIAVFISLIVPAFAVYAVWFVDWLG